MCHFIYICLYIFLHLTVMHSSTFGKGWVGMSACPLVVLACESLHVCTVCIWRCEHARFCVEVFYALYINFHSFIHSFCVCVHAFLHYSVNIQRTFFASKYTARYISVPLDRLQRTFLCL